MPKAGGSVEVSTFASAPAAVAHAKALALEAAEDGEFMDGDCPKCGGPGPVKGLR